MQLSKLARKQETTSLDECETSKMTHPVYRIPVHVHVPVCIHRHRQNIGYILHDVCSYDVRVHTREYTGNTSTLYKLLYTALYSIMYFEVFNTHTHTRVHAHNITHSILTCEGTRLLASELVTGVNCIKFSYFSKSEG